MQIACPSCKRQLRIADSAAGKKVKCPACGTSFTALDQVEELVEPGPPPPKPKPKADVVDIVEEPKPRRPRDEEEDRPRRPRDRDEDDRPRRSRDRDYDDEDYDDRSRRGRREVDDDDDYDGYQSSRKEARRRGQSSAVWFLLAGIVTLVVIVMNIITSLLVTGPAQGPNVGAYQAGRIVGILGCGVVGVIAAIFQFLASSNLKSFQS